MYSNALVKRGDQVDVISLRKKGESKREVIEGVPVYRIQERSRNEKSRFSYLYRLIKFLILSGIFFSVKNFQNKYDIIHVHSVPDFEVFAIFFAKLTRGKIILDIHDIVPEFYASKFKTNTESLLFRSLVWVEKASIAFSDHVIIANDLWKQKLVCRSVKEEKCTAILNYPDNSIFYARPRKREDNRFIIVYPGSLNWHQGVDIAIKAINLIKEQIPEVELHVYGEGGEEKRLIDLVNKLELKGRVIFNKAIPRKEIVNVMANADLGVVPKRASLFGNEAFSTKILEFMALGVPVVVSSTKIDRYYFSDTLVNFFESDNERDLAKCLLLLIRNPERREFLVMNGFNYIKKNNWDIKKEIYLNLVDSLKNGNMGFKMRG
jgi:glycosyltransferase involved in cell wall biosynthesis